LSKSFTEEEKDTSSTSFISTTQVEVLFKERYEYEHKRKENLDKKANNLLVGATTAVTIYAAFGALAGTNFFTTALGTSSTIIPLIFGLTSLIVGIILSIIALSLRDYWTPFNLDDFGTVSNEKFSVKSKEVNELRNTDPALLSAITINTYIEYSLRNKKINNGKANWIISSQVLFILGISSIPIYLILL